MTGIPEYISIPSIAFSMEDQEETSLASVAVPMLPLERWMSEGLPSGSTRSSSSRCSAPPALPRRPSAVEEATSRESKRKSKSTSAATRKPKTKRATDTSKISAAPRLPQRTNDSQRNHNAVVGVAPQRER
ncbi:expressed unknown protein [Seminavis robusta]|uniref:Uncharacterized protein n=1 Tax=Seminavis robusta TaxID=568900 RepID=A0A9N8D655_9STRA|nr:expressed unknown protein [Seminavis robusta]|eukprot:Sro10_g008031.1  (131) ;mRNA; r:88849-89241